MRKPALFLAAMLALFSSHHAGAADVRGGAKAISLIPSICQAPCIDYAINAELEDDGIFATSPSSLTSNNLEPTLESEISIAPVDHLRFVSKLTLEQVVDPEPGQSEAFRHIGGLVEQLYVEYDDGPWMLQAGKIHPAFGRGWDSPPGLHATDIPGNYELDERIGAGGAYGFNLGEFEHEVQASVFTIDRTVLSDSLFTNRGRTRLSAGGAGNTRGLSSVALSLDGCLGAAPVDCYDDGDFGYQLAGLYQRAGKGDANDELGFVASVNKGMTFDTKIVRLIGEAAYFRNFEGSSDDALFLTASGELEIDQMTYSLAYTLQQNLPSSGPDTSEQLVDLTASYQLGNSFSLAGEEWAVGLGYAFDRNDAEDTHTITLLFAVDFNGTIRLGGAAAP